MPKLSCVTPFLRCPNIDYAVAFFVGTLRFQLSNKVDHFARVCRDDVQFLLYGDGVQLQPRGGGRYTSYIDINDADALYAEPKPKLDLLPPGHVCPPADIIASGSPLTE